ncbi:TATA-binding protein-associated factor [Starmerella bacillaris]|uniref:TATA-binding protein-associated factor n=1 Tax=Starmerella bacillaris TaxID=1247836 RepID=A0AAV5RE18_STABA|nr:TATA-binding protein-associated factor [Starmerella bacillaris]
MADKIKRTVRITTQQKVLTNVPKIDGVFPMREWRISVSLLGANGKEYPAIVFDKVIYELHETFANPRRVTTAPPFEVVEKGWGEFEMKITFKLANGGGDHTVGYDLHFKSPENYVDIEMDFPANNKALVEKLNESGSVESPNNANATQQPGDKRPIGANAPANKSKKPKVTIKGTVDLERLSHGLEQLSEQDVLSIVQMISDNKTPEIYVKNDVEVGEFHVDLFTVPNGLLKSMWDFVSKKVDV